MNLLSQIKQKVASAYAANGFDGYATLVRLSDRPDISDYQSNGALGLAKSLKQNPREIATKIATVLKEDPFFAAVTVDGPGFINMKIADTALETMAYTVLSDNKCGYERIGAAQKIVMDYGGPNCGKVLHVGHLRTAVIGESIKRICRFVGDEVISDVHLGDWGKPMGQIITEIQDRQPDLVYFDETFTGDYPETAPFTKEDLLSIYPIASQKSKEDETFNARAKENTRLLQEGHRGYRALWHKFIDMSVADIKELYAELGIEFELWRGESHVQERLIGMVQRLKKEGKLILDEGAYIVPLGKSKNGNDLPPLIVVKSDGAVSYGATDLATVEERVEEFHPDRILYVIDARQSIALEQVFSASASIGLFPADKLEFLGFGTVNGKDNKPYKTRSGGVPTLRSLIDLAVCSARTKMETGEMGKDLTDSEKNDISKIVGVSALKFADLMNERAKNYIFDEEKLTSIEGKTGPYILYAIVRMKSILEKMKQSATLSEADTVRIQTPAERALMLRLYALPDFVQTAYDNRAPHVICDYLFKLAQDFNTFYHDCPIKGADESTQKSRLALTKYTLHVMVTMVDLLGLKVPDKM
ncbi:MAG: arginine--tRNA ligase [Alphaproteobacteria bacterium]